MPPGSKADVPADSGSSIDTTTPPGDATPGEATPDDTTPGDTTPKTPNTDDPGFEIRPTPEFEIEEPKIDPRDLGEVTRLGPTTDDPYAIAWSPETKTLAVCGYSGQITTWELDGEKPAFTKAIKNPGYCIVFTTDGKSVLTGHDNGTVAVTRVEATTK